MSPEPTPVKSGLASTISGLGSPSTASAIDTSGSPLAGSAAIYADSIEANYGVGNKLTQKIQVADGSYVVDLHFAEYYNYGVGGRLFDIRINGVLVATNFDIYAQAGNAINKAVVASFATTATGGNGILVELINKAGQAARISADRSRQGYAVGRAADRQDRSFSRQWPDLGTGRRRCVH